MFCAVFKKKSIKFYCQLTDLHPSIHPFIMKDIVVISMATHCSTLEAGGCWSGNTSGRHQSPSIRPITSYLSKHISSKYLGSSYIQIKVLLLSFLIALNHLKTMNSGSPTGDTCTRSKGHTASANTRDGDAVLPVSGVDPAGALVNVVNVIDFSIKVSGFLPTLR